MGEKFGSLKRVPQFKRVVGGYSPREVDAFIAEMIYCYDQLIDEKQKLLAEVKVFRKQKLHLSELLIQSRQEIETIIGEAKQKADSLLKEAEAAREMMEQDIMNAYQQKSAGLMSKFFFLAKKSLEELDHQFSAEVKKTFTEADQSSALTREKQMAEYTGADTVLIGRVLATDLHDDRGNVIVHHGAVITPRLLETIIGKGYYGELIEALDPVPDLKRKDDKSVAG
jgi:hypothetical protein